MNGYNFFNPTTSIFFTC